MGGKRRRTRDPLADPDTLARLLTALYRQRDTPGLIAYLAAEPWRLLLCKALVSPVSEADRQLARRASDLLRHRGLDPKRLQEQLEPAAYALGLASACEAPLDYYHILTVAPSATPQEIRAAYRQKAPRVHPDTAQAGKEDPTAFIQLQTAYDTLMDPHNRAAYDRCRNHLGAWQEGRENQTGTDRSSRKVRRTGYKIAAVVGVLLAATWVAGFLFEEYALLDLGYDPVASDPEPTPPPDKEPRQSPKKEIGAAPNPAPRKDTPGMIPATVEAGPAKGSKLSEAQKDRAEPITAQRAPSPQPARVTPGPEPVKPQARTVPEAPKPRPVKKAPEAMETDNSWIAPGAAEQKMSAAVAITRPKQPEAEGKATDQQPSPPPASSGSSQDPLPSSLGPEAQGRAKADPIKKAQPPDPVPETPTDPEIQTPSHSTHQARAGSQTEPGPRPKMQFPTDVPLPSQTVQVDRSQVQAFVNQYTSAYEKGQAETFFSFFTPDATENGNPLKALTPRYQELWDKMQSLDYRISITRMDQAPEGSKVSVTGRFTLWWEAFDQSWGQSQGEIVMELEPDGGDLRVSRLRYEFD